MMVKRIQMLCKGKDTTFAQLERKLGFSNGSIRRWDTNSPSVDKVLKVADHFKVSIDNLVGKAKEENK